ncbi:MAG TPA: hypothetical protein VFD91_08180 [Mariniphaga sp.]|nr:hypothetical protein [Mariniphaga sp.]
MFYQEKIVRKYKKSKLLIIIVILTVSAGCSRLNVARIQFNPEKKIYEYPLPGMPAIALRTNDGSLVTETNFDHFITELSLMDFRYPFDERAELAGPPKNSDYEIATLYANSIQRIKQEDYPEASAIIQQLENEYPKSLLYTDLAFLKGYVHEKLGQTNEARKYYSDYLSFSSQKFSERFRDNKYADFKDELWIRQKDYASNVLAQETPQNNTDFLTEIQPKYYFTDLQPGYTLSTDRLTERPRGIFSVALGKDLSSNISAGFQYYRNIANGVDINPEFSISRNMWELRFAVPLQLYRSDNNRFGIKVSPFGHYSRINIFRQDGIKYDVHESVFNYGVKTSAGFYIIQRLSLGAYYTYNFHNANNPFDENDQLPAMWWDNEYDVSLYFPLIKGLNLKGGIKSGDWVAGFYMPGWEVSYNINEGSIILRTEMY